MTQSNELPWRLLRGHKRLSPYVQTRDWAISRGVSTPVPALRRVERAVMRHQLRFRPRVGRSLGQGAAHRHITGSTNYRSQAVLRGPVLFGATSASKLDQLELLTSCHSWDTSRRQWQVSLPAFRETRRWCDSRVRPQRVDDGPLILPASIPNARPSLRPLRSLSVAIFGRSSAEKGAGMLGGENTGTGSLSGLSRGTFHIVYRGSARWLDIDFKRSAVAGSSVQIVHRLVHRQRLIPKKVNADKGIGRE